MGFQNLPNQRSAGGAAGINDKVSHPTINRLPDLKKFREALTRVFSLQKGPIGVLVGSLQLFFNRAMQVDDKAPILKTALIFGQ